MYTLKSLSLRWFSLSLGLLLLWSPLAVATHDGGESIELLGASRDGRFALAVTRNINLEVVTVGIHDGKSQRWMKRLKVGEPLLRKTIRTLKRAYRIRRLPSARSCDRRRHVCARTYEWVENSGARNKTLALVGPLRQLISPASRVRCVAEPDECRQKNKAMAKTSKAHYFSTGAVLWAENWIVKSSMGNDHVALFVHRFLPPRPTIPATVPGR
jgi:hypothetical protein